RPPSLIAVRAARAQSSAESLRRVFSLAISVRYRMDSYRTVPYGEFDGGPHGTRPEHTRTRRRRARRGSGRAPRRARRRPGPALAEPGLGTDAPGPPAGGRRRRRPRSDPLPRGRVRTRAQGTVRVPPGVGVRRLPRVHGRGPALR